MTKKIRILYTIPNFNTAGSGKVLYDLAKGLNKDYFEVIIACKHNEGAFFNEVKALDLPIHFIDATVPLRPYLSLFIRIQAFKNFIKKHNIDIVHSWHWSSDWSEVLATRLTKAKFVYTKKAMSWGNVHWKIRSFLSHFIITVNTEMTQFFSYKKNQKLIPFGLDTNFYSPEKNLKEDSTNSFKIVTVANLVSVKNIEVIIKAIKETSRNDILLDIIGDADTNYAEKMKQLVNTLKLNEQVSFLGKHIDIRPFLTQADLYIISSKKEGMPMALVEAMAMQVPVLGSDIPGIRYVLNKHKDLLFETNDYHGLSLKILEMYNKSKQERLKIGKELRECCIEHFSLNTFVVAHETLYFKLAKRT